MPGYEIVELLSWGSQGDVFLARDRAGERVAMKIVTADRGDGDPEAMARLAREAKLLAAIESPHVVRVRELVQCEKWSCLVLEFLAGQRLDAAVRERAGTAATVADAGIATVRLAPDRTAPSEPTRTPGPRPVPAPLCTPAHVEWALQIAVQLATGVATLHRQGLVHRDLKPQNAMLVDGRLVLIDFGFARMAGLTTLTQTGAAIGTLAYMSPEQFRGAPASERGDVFAIGATLHQCLCGHPPGDDDLHTLAAISARRRPPDLRRRNTMVSRDLAAVVARCLEPDPDDRYADANELLADLQRCRRGERVRRPFSMSRLWRHQRRRIGVAAMSVLLLLVAWLLFAGFDAERSARAIAAAVHGGRADAAMAMWLDVPVPARDAVLTALNHHVTDVAHGTAVAKALGLGVLAVAPRPRHRIAVARCGGDGTAAFAAGTFVAVDAPRALLVPPGRVWCCVMSAESRYWWAPEDPRGLQMLLDVGVADGAPSLRSLTALPTERAPRRLAAAVFAAGSHRVPRASGTAEVVLSETLSVACHEVDRALLREFRLQMAGALAQRAELDAWLRHPDEPESTADPMWLQWCAESRGDDDDGLPAQVTFWEAHRLACFFGFRLPCRSEWEVVAGDDGRQLGSIAERAVPPQPEPVAATPTWDRTRRGICFANSNVAEWTLDRDLARNSPSFLVMPLPMRMQGVATFSPGFTTAVGMPAAARHGLRLYRQRLPLR